MIFSVNLIRINPNGNLMKMTMRLKTIITTLLLMATVVVSAQGLKTNVDEDRKAEIRETLALDYSIPDYSTSKANPKVIGQRLADILNKFQEMSESQTVMGPISVIQAQQIEGMIYCAVKKVKLNNVQKQGNTITIIYDTELAQNQNNIKKSKLVFSFIDGVSNDTATNDLFTNICRYIKEQ